MIRLWFTLSFLVLYTPAAIAMDSLRIDARELFGLMQQNRVVVLDARPAAEYQQGHLPGARSLPFATTFENMSENGRVISLQKAQALLSETGLKRGDLVVVYDAGVMLHAARLLWTLEVYGQDNVRVLDGGLKAWQMAGLPLSQEVVRYAPSRYVPSVDPKRLATRITTLVASRTPKSYVILDARATPHYQGLESDATRFGHIPEAKGIAISNNLAADGIHLKSREELAALYKDIPKDKKVITYCSVGIASSLEYLVMRELGYNVANYDASWKEWGNDPSLPIEDPAKGDAERR
jgi:thiosulfate/3-mercaptopyruvate sulfurtransferase